MASPPALRLRRLELRAQTNSGLFGVDIPLDDGLVILRADNSSGKSTCVQSIIYALGLEGMLGASRDVPLPHAMTHSLSDGGVERPVVESWVALEIESAAGTRIRLERSAKSKSLRNELVRTWTVSPDGVVGGRTDYFVRLPGGATREAGFHDFLAEFVGWTLPEVARYDGTICPLYMETLFPLFFVEQKHGWTGIQARMPTHYRIREVGKRAVEFVLHLDAYANSLRRAELQQEALLIQHAWSERLSVVQSRAKQLGALATGFPVSPVSDWPPQLHPEVLFPQDDKWHPLETTLADMREALAVLERSIIPRVNAAAAALEESLRESLDTLAQLETIVHGLNAEVRADQVQIRSLDHRVRSLREDLERNRDVLMLQRLGGIAELETSKGVCPTCHQPVSTVLQLVEPGQQPMAVEENVKYIESQITLFGSMRDALDRALRAKDARAEALQQQVRGLRAQIRAQKTSLVADGNQPSEAAIEERIRLRTRLNDLTAFADILAQHVDAFSTLMKRWQTNQVALAALNRGDLSVADETKLSAVENAFVVQVRAYGLSSVDPSSLKISRETYRPIHEGFDLGFDLSASDMIRTIWAYLYGILEVARAERTNHLGLLILDEPRQQETSRISYGAFLRRAGEAARNRQQVIFATSEETDSLGEMLRGVPHKLIAFDEKILKRLSA